MIQILKRSIIVAGLIPFLSVHAQNADKAYSEKVRKNAYTFHKNFSTGDFVKNGDLVNPKIYVNSNEAIVIGAPAFVKRIQRFHTPFPHLVLRDEILIVDDNNVALVYCMQDKQDGPYGSIPASGRKMNVYATEYFTMDENAKMKELLTITQLDRLKKQITGKEDIANFDTITPAPISKTTPAYKHLLKGKVENFVQNFNARDWDALKDQLTDGVKVNWNGRLSSGKQAVIDGLSTYLTLVPDLTFHEERNVVEGQRGAIAYTRNGTFTKDGVAKPIEAKEGAHFVFDTAGNITEIIVISNEDEIAGLLK